MTPSNLWGSNLMPLLIHLAHHSQHHSCCGNLVLDLSRYGHDLQLSTCSWSEALWRDLQDALNYSNYYLDAQKVGTLPVDNSVPWRSDAMTYEVGPDDRDITGGYLMGGMAGNLKMTHPTAFSVALLAWGLLQFPNVRLLILQPQHDSPHCLLCCSSRLWTAQS